MTEHIVLAILVALPATLASLAVLIRSMKNISKLDEIKTTFNGRTEALMQAREEQAFQRGVYQGRSER